MSLTAVTHYTLSSHPRNPSIVDITERDSDSVAFIKIRHKIPDGYAVSLVDPKTFIPHAESQAKNATVRARSIVLHNTAGKEMEIDFKDTARLGFEWCFEWEGEKYRWVRESRITSVLECRCVRKTGSVCVAQYLPCSGKNGYFGLFSVVGYNLASLDNPQGLKIILCMTLLIMLDKSDASGWLPKRNTHPEMSLKEQQKLERENEQKLQQMIEKDLKRMQKRIVHDDKVKSTNNSPSHSPQVSPVPTPSASTEFVSKHQQPSQQLRTSLKHLDATATLQLPSTAAAPYTNLESLFQSPAPPPPQQQQQPKKPQSQPPQRRQPSPPNKEYHFNTSNASSNGGTTTATTSPYYYYYGTQQQQKQQKTTTTTTTTTSRVATGSTHAKRPVAQRRVSTGDQLMQYYPAMRMYPHHPHHPATTMHHAHHPLHHNAAAAAPLPPASQRYPGDYYYMYQQ
ncbi:predicted protein [Lichtheimia corymbifera JMRC:FSU:9682]|uniref:Uncharacterized protein n=1 Tax=Lichtheimia corymbifera JMRC:FSU:9682 TaxID=1263082 RepID=A0A068RQX3_9FUNG|nr:predicted protein [Lichtheimia corymbifera JMRC:FSU:9682]CDH59623.1 predicted protein [Lichtheimia corymbifera JMRC:FSU:9682]